MKLLNPVVDRVAAHSFDLVHRNNLVYNACWEDPRLDRVALNLKSHDTVVVITSAGCNALDYALESPQRVYAVDMNPRQNALLELKLAGLKKLDHDTFFAMFGRGRLPNVRDAYYDAMRDQLTPSARAYWDRRIGFFSGHPWHRSFYFCGTSGLFARVVNFYIDRVARLRDWITAILSAPSVGHQREIYERQLGPAFWNRFLRWAMGRDATLSLLGVPQPQRQQVEGCFPGGIARFIEDSVETVFTRLPLADNYFWRVYLTGEYTTDCCPEYLRAENFAWLRANAAARVVPYTGSVTEFLRQHDAPISRFVLLDHMDWLHTYKRSLLAEEWQAIVDRAAPRARLLWRSGGLQTDFVNTLKVCPPGSHGRGTVRGGVDCRVGDLLQYQRTLAAELHPLDRVHTYGSFFVADLAV